MSRWSYHKLGIEVDDLILAQAQSLDEMTAKALKRPSPNTSQPNMKSQDSATVIPLKSSS